MSRSLFTVIMVTRNRPVSLKKCLGRTRFTLPSEIPIIVFDDASTDAKLVRKIVESYANTTCLRSELWVGPGEGRNRCIQAASTAYCFSIDDDCYLDAVPDLSRWMVNRSEDADIAAVCFRYFNLDENKFAPESSTSGETGHFLGGASLLRRETMLRTGGYLDWLVFAREDTELAMRLRRLGYRIWYDPSVIVKHDHSVEGRDERWASFYYVRNTWLINVIHGNWLKGVPLGLLKALHLGRFHAARSEMTWFGICAGLFLLPKCFQARRSLFNNHRCFNRSR